MNVCLDKENSPMERAAEANTANLQDQVSFISHIWFSFLVLQIPCLNVGHQQTEVSTVYTPEGTHMLSLCLLAIKAGPYV